MTVNKYCKSIISETLKLMIPNFRQGNDQGRGLFAGTFALACPGVAPPCTAPHSFTRCLQLHLYKSFVCEAIEIVFFSSNCNSEMYKKGFERDYSTAKYIPLYILPPLQYPRSVNLSRKCTYYLCIF